VSPQSSSHKLYPLFLQIAGRAVLVVGGGGVAQRKAQELLAAGARVTLVAPGATEAIRELASEGSLTWQARPFAPADVAGAWLVVSATDDPSTQREVYEAADACRTFVVAVDDPANGSAQTPAVVERAPYVVAISSGGETPALTRLLRELIEQALPDAEWVEAARALRAKWKTEGTPMASRFPELVRLFQERAKE
jgi:uroporphyrin-III C-methyltransferase/precorrin-2 dehydrogenase/sirohydrochlorin ferrochelatase